jgi:hypothetical protein
VAFINTTINLKEYPLSVKLAILFLALGWGLHYLFYFKFLMYDEPVRNLYLQVGLGIGICYFVASINRWAKAMCIFFNLGIVIIYLVLFANYVLIDKPALSVFTVTIALLFCLSTYYLLIRKTREFFYIYGQTEDDNPSPGNFQ